MNIWLTSDTHYGHFNILTYCSRPFKDVNYMNEELIKRYNEKVQPEDIVYHLGDFSLSGHWVEPIIKRLNGSVILIQGNHDKTWRRTKDHQTVQKYLEYGFKDVVEELYIKHRGYLFWLAHIPPDYTDHRGRNLERPVCIKDGVNFILHGHSHSPKENRRRDKHVLDVGVDGHDYYPWHIDEVIEELTNEKV